MQKPDLLFDTNKAEDLLVDFSEPLCWKLSIKCSDKIRISTLNFLDLSLPPEKVLLAQNICLEFLELESFSEGAFTTEPSFDKCKTILFALETLYQQHPDKRVSDLSLDQINSIIILMLFTDYTPNSKDPNSKFQRRNAPLSKQKLEVFLSALKLWHLHFVQGRISDGPSHLAATSYLNPILTTIFDEINLNFHDWHEGGSYGSIPFAICHLLLADALTIISSTKSQQLAIYFEFVRNCASLHHTKTFWGPSGSKPLWQKYRKRCDIKALAAAIKNYDSTEAKQCMAEFVTPLHEALSCCIEGSNESTQPFPWQSFSELCNDYREVISAVIVVFLSVMGKRGPSEVRTLRASDIKLPLPGKSEHATVHPAIFKTHNGQRISHGITGYIDEAFYLALKLGNIVKEGTDLPLFSAPPTLITPAKTPATLSTDRLSAYLHSYYNSFVSRTLDKVDFDIKDIHQSITSHQFRHSFAEFALRRYDGNVEELLRQHFLHAYGHWWTKRYTADKLDEDHIQRLNKSYIKELIPRIALDSTISPDFVGGMALFIRSIIDNNILSLPPAEVENHISSFSERIISITPHEYGWCLIYKDFSTQAKCADSTGSPTPSATSQSKCIGCVNFCASRSSHLATNTKIVISHLDFLEQKTWHMQELKEQSRLAVLNSQKLFPELKSLGDPNAT